MGVSASKCLLFTREECLPVPQAALRLVEHLQNLGCRMSWLMAPLLLQAAGWFGIFTSAYAFYLALAFLFEVRGCVAALLRQQLSCMVGAAAGCVAGAAAGRHGWQMASARRREPLADIGAADLGREWKLPAPALPASPLRCCSPPPPLQDMWGMEVLPLL